MSKRRSSKPTTSGNREQTIGRDGCAIRVLNFAGGGFDTVMHLGVIHALLVIQGRAPDAVVGVSAGAIQAAALAEILQAGEQEENRILPQSWDRCKDNNLKRAAQKARLDARVARFREFLNTCQRAPERMVDAILPDAYQIESSDALEPLETPIFAREERDSRKDAVIGRSGLVHLYNDLLSIHIPVGTLTRIVRRILGYRATAEIRNWVSRQLVRCAEILRIWLLVGIDLLRLVPLVPLLLIRPLVLGKASAPNVASAGQIIFRFKMVDRAKRALSNAVSFLLLLSFWVGLSWIAMSPFLLAFGTSDYFLLIILVLLLGIFPLTEIFTGFSRTANHFRVLVDFVTGTMMFLYLLAKWTIVLIVIVFPPFFILEVRRLEINKAMLRGLIEAAAVASLVGIVITVSLVVLIIGFFLIHLLRRKLRKAGSPRRGLGAWYVNRLLTAYNISKSLFQSHWIEVLLSEFFDPNFYGPPDLDEVVEDVLASKTEASSPKAEGTAESARKPISAYAKHTRNPPIHVGLAVADVSTGDLEVVPPKEAVVTGLLAAVSATPFFPPKNIGGRLFIDGSNVTNIPTRALIKLLRDKINKNSEIVHIYRVAPLRFSEAELGEDPRDEGSTRKVYLNLLDIALRAIQLRKFRDANLERRLTELYTRVIPHVNPNTGRSQVHMEVAGEGKMLDGKYFRAWVTPIELEEPVSLNQRIIFAPKEKRYAAILESVADGCRAALEVMIAPAIKEAAGRRKTIACRLAVEKHKQQRKKLSGIAAQILALTLPGSEPEKSPGLSEVCEHCALNRSRRRVSQNNVETQVLKRRNWHQIGPAWPHEREQSESGLETDPHFEEPKSAYAYRGETERALKKVGHLWPRKTEWAGDRRPVVGLLFSGGVFRGVFQMGVANALNELGIKPDLVAGASVGSITGAMIANAFSIEDEAIRKAQLARLAAVYLSIDSLVLTDRFADFVRNVTIRAANTGFSLREADQLFRRYDHPRSGTFDRRAREVIAGLERLFYVNPYQLNRLVKCLRNNDRPSFQRLLRELVQQWFDKMEVGDEMLGVELLEKLVRYHVIPEDPLRGHESSDRHVSFDTFSTQKGIYFLATATNLTKGRLEILGLKPDGDAESGTAATTLLDGLLASSAFPGVFRPRWSWELHPGTEKKHQYIDGGVMDNIPVEAAIEFLTLAANVGLVARRPIVHVAGTKKGRSSHAIPHLLFAASLEPNTEQYESRKQWAYLESSWVDLSRRAKELHYNVKLRIYERAEAQLRQIYEALVGQSSGRAHGARMDFVPLDVQLVSVKPEWLCGTFAFHPMLGFRRARQAKSIAHGCALTLLRFAEVKKEHNTYLKGWGVEKKNVPDVCDFNEAQERWRKVKWKAPKGCCWLRPSSICPYSKESLRSLTTEKAPLQPRTRAALTYIHRACRKLKTHRRAQ
jgi:predicted acylesterase/phospholipase RssA